ncbi:Sphingomyelinase C precursor [Alloactinosynnema sp. L-07]|uniref:sphingomyelin phosphodiesterase n=1 Tax=Alloactinosynnema sp. L-07 TaxID=1653480 RepID=UPI00065F01FB|nr:sphingomyelin phosphodiesterase [Alloactinosynnema sp. L-07]CRK61940.1 Sphingomyelinase C precursor [Alloactinosynnema sp. L-07]
MKRILLVAAALLAAATPAHAAPATTVSVLAFNIYQLPRVADGDVAAKEKRARDAEAAIRAADADVVILSEAFSAEAESLRGRLADRWPAQTPLVGQHCSTSPGWTTVNGNCSNSVAVVNGGVTVLSKYAVTAKHQLVYRNSFWPTADYYSNKGAALVRVVKNGRAVWVAGTHLQADQSPFSIARSHEVRMGQLGELRVLVDKYAPASEPVIVGGDLNVEYWAGRSRLDGSGRDQVQQAAAAVGGPIVGSPVQAHTYDGVTNSIARANGGAIYRDVLDYIGATASKGRPLASVGAVRTLGFGQGEPSDHYPVLATVAY